MPASESKGSLRRAQQRRNCEEARFVGAGYRARQAAAIG